MIVDCHAHVFANWIGACGHPTREVHRRYLQRVVTRTVASTVRLRDGARADTRALFRAGFARAAAGEEGVRAVIFRSPCVALVRGSQPCTVSSGCAGCRRCIRELGCPALHLAEGRAAIDPALCTGCGLCAQLCPAKCITKEAR